PDSRTHPPLHSFPTRRSSDLYDRTMPAIEASGEFPPDGLDYHLAFSAGGSFRVSEVWDSKEQFEAFGERLMPILAEGGIELAGPDRKSTRLNSSHVSISYAVF